MQKLQAYSPQADLSTSGTVHGYYLLHWHVWPYAWVYQVACCLHV